MPERRFSDGLEEQVEVEIGNRCFPISYGHWRSWDKTYPEGYEIASWYFHCGKPLFLLGKRASQAAGLLSQEERVTWIAKGGWVLEREGKKRWRPAVSENELRNAYPLP